MKPLMVWIRPGHLVHRARAPREGSSTAAQAVPLSPGTAAEALLCKLLGRGLALVNSFLVYQNSNYSVPTIRDTVLHLKESRVGDGKAGG